MILHFPWDPWDWYIYTYTYHKSTIHVGTYTIHGYLRVLVSIHHDLQDKSLELCVFFSVRKASRKMWRMFFEELPLEQNTVVRCGIIIIMSRWWFQIFFIFTPTRGRFPFWRAYFSNGLKPPTSYNDHFVALLLSACTNNSFCFWLFDPSRNWGLSMSSMIFFFMPPHLHSIVFWFVFKVFKIGTTYYQPIALHSTYMDVSENSGFSPQIIHLFIGFHYKPSILGYPLFLETPISYHDNLRSCHTLEADQQICELRRDDDGETVSCWYSPFEMCLGPISPPSKCRP